MARLNARDDHSELAANAFFGNFPAASIEALEKSSTLRKFRKNTHIIVAGEESHAAYLLLQGSAYAFTDDNEGNEFIVATFGPGDCFGELGLLDGQTRTANVITTSMCECLVVPRTEIHQQIANEPAVAGAIINGLVERIRGMTEEVSCLALMDVYGRLVRILNSSTQQLEDGGRVVPRLTHQELAKRVGSSREMISKILKELRIGGYLTIENHQIRILKNLPDRW
jgi:CRP/FNR family cyclic AMP-dependent transcriptional regulator